jgi:uncharacterized protein YacL
MSATSRNLTQTGWATHEAAKRSDVQRGMMNVNRILWLMTMVLFGVIGGATGWLGGRAYANNMADNALMRDSISFTIAISSAIVMARVGSWLADRLIAGLGRVNQMSAADRVLGIVGILLGLLFGSMVSLALPNVAAWMIPVKLFIMAVSAALGMALLQGMRDEVLRAFPALGEREEGRLDATAKFLDTNIIIDGRIVELCRSGFIDGPLYVPYFVLNELQYIADSADSMRRTRGRRGLETLGAMREIMVPVSPDANGNVAAPQPLVNILNEVPNAVAQTDTVDSKLVVLARMTGGSILTNDFNLNRVAGLQGVRVLNVNALALAMKPVVLPGEELTITISREGKEPGQGIGYLDDGTMIVVSEARPFIGQTCVVTILQVIQTVAGKMIFAEMGEGKDPGAGESKTQKGAGDDLFGDKTPSGKNSDDFGGRSSGGVRRKSRS